MSLSVLSFDLFMQELWQTKARLGTFLQLDINQASTNYSTKSRKPQSCLEIGHFMATKEISSELVFLRNKPH